VEASVNWSIDICAKVVACATSGLSIAAVTSSAIDSVAQRRRRFIWVCSFLGPTSPGAGGSPV